MTENNVFIVISVKTGKPKFDINIKGEKIFISLKNKPVQNKANIELIKELTALFKRPATLVSGHNSKNKKLKIEGITKMEAYSILRNS